MLTQKQIEVIECAIYDRLFELGWGPGKAGPITDEIMKVIKDGTAEEPGGET